MANPTERPFKFQVLSRRPDGAHVISGTLGMERVELLFSAEDWEKLSEEAGWFAQRPNSP